MTLYAYFQEDRHGFVLFFNNKGRIYRANVENIHGLRDILLNGNQVNWVNTDDIKLVQEMLDLELQEALAQPW